MLHYVNHNVKQAELHHKLMDYKGRLDLSALEKSNSPIAAMYKVCFVMYDTYIGAMYVRNYTMHLQIICIVNAFIIRKM